MDSYVIRPAVCMDIPQLIRLRLAYLQEDFEAELPADKAAAVAAQLPDYFTAHIGKDCFPFVAEIPDGTLISCVILCTMEKPANLSFPSGKSGTVLGVYTMPEYRGSGYATKLMSALLQKSQELSLDMIKLSASKMGQPIYQKLGFTVSHTHFTEMEYHIPK